MLGYAMSRLDSGYLSATGASNWRTAFSRASSALGVPATSFKNLRDEFDPIHSNDRLGWRNRELRPNRQQVANEFAEVSDEALTEFVRRILARDNEATAEAIDSLLPSPRVPANVAERLLTGRKAEQYFLEHSEILVGIAATALLDCRLGAKGYDFAAGQSDNRVFEVKGIRRTKGEILFTDREWSEAAAKRDCYWLVVIGDLDSKPRARIFQDPCRSLIAKCVWRTTLSASWRSNVTVRG